ncbi:hypothetical protein BJX63DRAFT_413362 [Aspergillus granulosus]|uniref:Secreted protein n=1 Tax=Aspergillus granulosus TaxID=176169 RepID=A0ABR4GWX6_9EURO
MSHSVPVSAAVTASLTIGFLFCKCNNTSQHSLGSWDLASLCSNLSCSIRATCAESSESETRMNEVEPRS